MWKHHGGSFQTTPQGLRCDRGGIEPRLPFQTGGMTMEVTFLDVQQSGGRLVVTLIVGDEQLVVRTERNAVWLSEPGRERFEFSFRCDSHHPSSQEHFGTMAGGLEDV